MGIRPGIAKESHKAPRQSNRGHFLVLAGCLTPFPRVPLGPYVGPPARWGVDFRDEGRNARQRDFPQPSFPFLTNEKRTPSRTSF